jgi:hypothetical protein
VTISFDSEAEDVVAAYEYHMFQTREGKSYLFTMRVTTVLTPALMIVPLSTIVRGLDAAWVAAGVVGVLLAGGVLSILRLRPDVRKEALRSIKQGPWDIYLCHHDVMVSPEGFRYSHRDGEWMIHWHLLKQWDSDADHLYFIWSNGIYFSIPKRAFHDANHLQGFLEMVERYREATPPRITQPTVKTSTVEPTVGSAANRAMWWRDRQNVDREETNSLRRQ